MCHAHVRYGLGRKGGNIGLHWMFYVGGLCACIQLLVAKCYFCTYFESGK